MKEILALIEAKKTVYSQSPFFNFMQDKSVHPRKRLAFVPCAAPFILGFTDLCKYALRQEPANSKIQSILNQHTYEDGEHWKWFIEDMANLGFNQQLKLNDALNFLWHDETKMSRLITYELYKYIAAGTAVEKLIILETIEGTADIFFSLTKKIADELQTLTHQEYKYFGGLHVAAEQDHEAHAEDVHQYIQNIELEEYNRQNSIALVEKVFALFTQWNQGLLTYAQSYQETQPWEYQLESRKLLEVCYYI